jgi:hypothetical protein
MYEVQDSYHFLAVPLNGDGFGLVNVPPGEDDSRCTRWAMIYSQWDDDVVATTFRDRYGNLDFYI